MNKLFILLQKIAPQHAISRFAGFLANSKVLWWKSLFIRTFISHYKVNMQEAEYPDPKHYACFNDFFTRGLKKGVRPICEGENTLACPADGVVSQSGQIKEGTLFQAKGHTYSVIDLLGGNEILASEFSGGAFSTVYLSPRDYHRVHMPIFGKLQTMIYVPGKLFSVNPVTTDNVPNLFARNERMVAYFDTPGGPMAMVMVGAMIVGSIESVWAGQVAPQDTAIQVLDYRNRHIHLNKGDEMGRFKLGSTIITLFAGDNVKLRDNHKANDAVTMGQDMGNFSLGQSGKTG